VPHLLWSPVTYHNI